MNKNHLNHVCFFMDGYWYVFERIGKDIPLGIYPVNRNLGKGESSDEAIRNSSVPNWDIEVIS